MRELSDFRSGLGCLAIDFHDAAITDGSHLGVLLGLHAIDFVVGPHVKEVVERFVESCVGVQQARCLDAQDRRGSAQDLDFHKGLQSFECAGGRAAAREKSQYAEVLGLNAICEVVAVAVHVVDGGLKSGEEITALVLSPLGFDLCGNASGQDCGDQGADCAPGLSPGRQFIARPTVGAACINQARNGRHEKCSGGHRCEGSEHGGQAATTRRCAP